ncbi:MAG: hypothetical protein U9R75_12105 [Candidatus Thermoplasmatota archaeon]|nr:hypothetical protein [Candidatus Thermoplasmatota archaeon]
MLVIEKGEELAKELDGMIDSTVVSAVVYGEDIHKEFGKGTDCNLLIILDRVDLSVLEIIHKKIEEVSNGCMKTPLIIELEEIEGMTDSVPRTFLNIMISYQVVYGKTLFKGLSSINHEHLRAQTEQSLREDLFHARYHFFKGISREEALKEVLANMRHTFRRSLKLYYLIKKPWITDEKEKLETFFKDFEIVDPWLKSSMDLDAEDIKMDEMKKMGISIIDNGLKPLLDKVDQMGP